MVGDTVPGVCVPGVNVNVNVVEGVPVSSAPTTVGEVVPSTAVAVVVARLAGVAIETVEVGRGIAVAAEADGGTIVSAVGTASGEGPVEQLVTRKSKAKADALSAFRGQRWNCIEHVLPDCVAVCDIRRGRLPLSTVAH